MPPNQAEETVATWSQNQLLAAIEFNPPSVMAPNIDCTANYNMNNNDGQSSSNDGTSSSNGLSPDKNKPGHVMFTSINIDFTICSCFRPPHPKQHCASADDISDSSDNNGVFIHTDTDNLNTSYKSSNDDPGG
jgi:hypothetical protein